jgi:hypothetical protein
VLLYYPSSRKSSLSNFNSLCGVQTGPFSEMKKSLDYMVCLIFHSFVGECMHDDGGLVFAYCKDGASDPTFLYFSHGLKEMKC